MKIAFDAKRALNNVTGLGNHARILLNALMRDFPENEYLLFAPKAKDEFFHQLHGNFKMFFPKTKLQKSFHPLWRSFGIKNQLRENRIDIYHGLSNEIPFNTQHSAFSTIVTIHDLIFLKHTEQYPWLDRQFYTLKTKYAAKHADKIIAVSHETKNDLIEMYGVPEKKIEVIYPSVDISFQANITTPKLPSKYNLPPKYILNVGSFFPRKNQAILIEAYSLIANQIEESLVLIGSSGTMKEEIQKIIRTTKLEQRIKILSGVSNEGLPAIYRNASAFVFPSLFEGFGAPVLEALFSKTPVITTGGGAIEEAAGKNSLFINPRCAEDIADKILKVLNNESLRQQMIDAGYSHAQTMTDTVFAKKVMNIYNEVCSV